MTDTYLLLTPFLVLVVVGLFGCVGCAYIWHLSHFTADNPIVVGETLMTPRNDFDGWVGMVIEAQGEDRDVAAIGRFCLDGNTQDHDLMIVDSTAIDVPVAQATVSLAGQPTNRFAYVVIPGARLKANIKYYLLSRETNGGDQFFDFEMTTVEPSNDGFFIVPSAVFGVPGAGGSLPTSYVEKGGVNNAYGPVDAHYVKAD